MYPLVYFCFFCGNPKPIPSNLLRFPFSPSGIDLNISRFVLSLFRDEKMYPLVCFCFFCGNPKPIHSNLLPFPFSFPFSLEIVPTILLDSVMQKIVRVRLQKQEEEGRAPSPPGKNGL
jgi:hypothetical protein